MRTSARTALIAGVSTLALGASTFVAMGLPGSDTRAADPVDVLRKDLDKILDEPALANAQASVVVRDSAGKELYSRDSAERLGPASNNKLYTSAAALEVLGPDHTFATELLSKGSTSGTTFTGDLYLKGSGDPSLLASDLETMAEKLAAEGITKVDGSVVGDDTTFTGPQLGDSWGWDDEPAYYAAPVSALTVSPDDGYNTATVVVDVQPGAAAGDPAKVSLLLPTKAVELQSTAKTSESGGSTSVLIDREHGTNVVTVSGTIPVGASAKRAIVSVPNATTYSTTLFREALAKHGVTVTGPDKTGATPSDATKVAAHESAPLSKLIVPFMKYSNNGHGELLTKATGVKASDDGSWDGGLAAADKALDGLGVDTAQLRRADGSGLSRKNLTAAEQLSNLLVSAQKKPWFEAWYDSLPIAGNPDPLVGGTLSSRMKGTAAENNVHAKTGSLTGVTALSGYVTDKDGKRLVFSIVHNNWVGDVNPKRTEDKIAIRLAEFTRGKAGARSSVPTLPKTTYGPLSIEPTWTQPVSVKRR